jgi:hypothetical protein
LNGLEGINSENVNFLTKTLVLELKENYKVDELIEKVKNAVVNIESLFKVIEKGIGKVSKKEILLEGLCCANCAQKYKSSQCDN